MNIIVDGVPISGLRLLHVGKNMVVAENDTSEFLIQRSRVSLMEFSKADPDGLSFDEVYRTLEPTNTRMVRKSNAALLSAHAVVEGIYSKWGSKIPGNNDFATVGQFLKIAGSAENLLTDLEELGTLGHLDKGRAYQMAALKNKARERAVQNSPMFTNHEQDEEMNMDAGKSRVDPGKLDGVVLPNGDVWSESDQRRYSQQEWFQKMQGAA